MVTVPLEDMDPDLLPLIGQFRSHLESMHANAAQVEGMDCAIWRAEIAVDSAFYRRSGVRQSDGIFDGI